MLEVQNLSVERNGKTVVEHVSFAAEDGQWLMIVGPNGAGKSTIVSAVSGCAPYTGRVLLDGDDVKRMKPAALAKKMGVLSQQSAVGYAFTVEEVVHMGRYAYSSGILGARDAAGDAKVEEALALTGLAELRDRSVLSLSGGELQRTFLAQLFAQDPQLLILDEPTNHLDPVYQRQIFDLIRDWMERQGRAVMTVVHDLSLARAYGTHALLMSEGKAAAQGELGQALSPERLRDVYGMDVYEWMQRMLSQWEAS